MRALDDYVEVHVRIGQFWEKHPDGRIETEILFPDENTVRCVARVYRDPEGDRPAAIGHAEEKRDIGMVNKTSAVENCETSAVGRALALLGFSIHKGIASREEVEIAQRKAGDEGADRSLGEYADWLIQAVRSYDQGRYSTPEKIALVKGDGSDEQVRRIVPVLKAELTELGADVKAIDERFLARNGAPA